jgi:hypothetical protein
MSLLCLELCTPGEVSIETDWLTLVVGVTCGNTARMGVGVGVLCSVFPRSPSGRRRRGDDLEQLRRDGAVEPCENMEVHANPMRNVGEDSVAQHVVGKGVFAKDEEEEAPPLGERRGVQVEDDRNKCADAENTQSLGVEGGDSIGVRCVVAGVVRRFVVLDKAVGSGSGGARGVSSLLEAAVRISQGELVMSHLVLKLTLRSRSLLDLGATCGGSLIGETHFSITSSSRVVVGHGQGEAEAVKFQERNANDTMKT